jgi:hypothetical protein
MTQLVKQPSKKHSSDQRPFIEALIEWIAMKSISFRSISQPSFREIIQRANLDFSVPVHNTPRSHINRLANVSRQLPEHQEKRYSL